MACSNASIATLFPIGLYDRVIGVINVVVASAGETPVRRMLGVLQAIISGQQPNMHAVHKLHELIVSGNITGDVSL